MEQFLQKYTKLAPAQRYLIGAGVVFALMAGHYFLVYDSQDQERGKIETKLRKAIEEQGSRQGAEQNKKKYEERLAVLQTRLDKAKAMLPDSAAVPELLAQLGNEARKTGLDIQNFQPQGEQVQDFYAQIEFKMQVLGSYHEIAQFIDNVGRLDRIINVTNLTMRNPKEQNQKMVVNSDMTVRTFRFVSDEERAASNAKAKNAKGKKKKRRK